MSNVSKSAPVSASAETTFRENPHRGSSREPLMNTVAAALLMSALRRACSASLDFATAPATVSFRLPSAAISRMMSHPPTSSPLT